MTAAVSADRRYGDAVQFYVRANLLAVSAYTCLDCDPVEDPQGGSLFFGDSSPQRHGGGYPCAHESSSHRAGGLRSS